jgi:hypothetical protein
MTWRALWFGIAILLGLNAITFAAFKSGFLVPGNNLNDLVSPSTAWKNLGGKAINPKIAPYNAICDGGSHPLSGAFASLAAAQAVYPFITSLSQQIDYAALKLASNTAFGADGSEHGSTNKNLNVPIFIPAGTCYIGADTWLIRNADGIEIEGAAADATTITGTGITMAFDGLWYSSIGKLTVATSGGIAALDIDGNVPGHPYATRTVQANTFLSLFVTGSGSSYALALCRQGFSNAQCSENVFINLHLSNANFAAYYQNGFNAIDNVLLGGDIQNYSKNGIYLFAGSLKVWGTSFESTFGYTQLANSGCDINAADAGAQDTILAYSNRSQGLCFYKGGAAQIADIRGFTQRQSSIFSWQANSAYSLNSMVVLFFDSDGVSYPYRVTTAGTSGSVAPSATTNVVTDGTVTWTYTPYNVVSIVAGLYDYTTSSVDATATVVAPAAFSLGNPQSPAGGGFYVDGSNAELEMCTKAQGPTVCTFANPQGSPETLTSGVTMPATSAGVMTPSGVDMYVGGHNSPSIKFNGSNQSVMQGPLFLGQFTFAGKPACSGSMVPAEIWVSDGTATGWGATIAGSGSGVKATCNGTNWVAE